MLRRRGPEVAWAAFAGANLVAMRLWPSWETVPFHLIWVSLTLLFGLRVWPTRSTLIVLGVVGLVTGGLIAEEALHGDPAWGELLEVPLMSAMFLAMVWHARSRQRALGAQQRFVHDASHELRTPVTIARGHLEQLGRRAIRGAPPEVEIALEELGRIERITERLLLLARADQPDFVVASALDVELLIENVFLRWAEIAPRVWRLGDVADGRLHADPDALRTALDALLENAVKYTEASAAIELRAIPRGRSLVIEVADEGPGIPEEAVGRVFERFGRADVARSRGKGGAGLGLAIVAAIAQAHGGSCSVRTSRRGSTFSLELPGFEEGDHRSRSPVSMT